MGFFTKDGEAKARRTQEREEQQRKAKAVPPPYVHTPTHALKDSLLSVPHAYKGTDKQRLKEAHKSRLEHEASALAAGSDTNVTNIPAKYWQGQPLPSQFKAPTPAGLRNLALSRPSLKGKKTEIPMAATAQQQQQAPTDQGHAPGLSRKKTGKLPCKTASLAEGPPPKPETKQYLRDQAAEAGREAEMERLRGRIRELEGNQRPQDDSGSKTLAVTAPASVRGRNAGPKAGPESRTSSSDATKGTSSGNSNKVDEISPPTSPSLTNGLDGNDGVHRYDWAIHWARAAARTPEERDSLPQANNPQQRPAPVATAKPRYTAPDEVSRGFESPETVAYSSNSRRRRSTRAPKRLGSVSAASNAADEGPKPSYDRVESLERSYYSGPTDFDFGFDATAMPRPLRLVDRSSRPWSQDNKAEPEKKRP